jgi:hypothetical protein
MDEECSMHVSNVYKLLIRESEGKRSLGRPSQIWEGNIKIELEETG